MKIREKLFLLLLTVIIAMVVLCNTVLLSILQQHTEKEKLDLYFESLSQVLISYEYVTDNIEKYAFESCRSEEIAPCMAQEKNAVARNLSIRAKLNVVIQNSPYFLDGIAVDTDHGICVAASDEADQQMRGIWQKGLFDQQKDILWINDESGNLYLKRTLYLAYPYRAVGYAVFLVDQEYLRASAGLDNLTAGKACIINEYGIPVLTTENTEPSDVMFIHLVDKIRIGEVLPRKYRYDETDYRLFAVNGISGTWSALQAIRVSELLSSYYELRNIILIAGAILILGAAVLSFMIAFGFTGNVRRLKRYVNDISHDKMDYRIPPMGKDEVGELADDFNGMLERLEVMYQAMLAESSAKQKAKYELLEFQYRSLQSQVSPHFLCNILSSISLLAISGNVKQVEKLSIDASRFLRSNLKNNDKKYHSIREEINLVEEYLTLANALSAVRIHFEINGTEEIMNTIIPNMILQPLVENSIKHGIPPEMHEDFRIELSVTSQGEKGIRIELRDNGIGYSETVIGELRRLREDPDVQPACIGFGTAGVIRRLALQYGESFLFHAGNSENGGAITTIELTDPSINTM